MLDEGISMETGAFQLERVMVPPASGLLNYTG
jgi:hypothetical protein